MINRARDRAKSDPVGLTPEVRFGLLDVDDISRHVIAEDVIVRPSSTDTSHTSPHSWPESTSLDSESALVARVDHVAQRRDRARVVNMSRLLLSVLAHRHEQGDRYEEHDHRIIRRPSTGGRAPSGTLAGPWRDG